jgi:hypothetical protein
VVADAAQETGESLRQMHAPALHTHEDDVRARLVAFGDLVSDARQSALEGGGIENDGRVRHKKIELAHPLMNRFDEPGTLYS